MGVPKPVNSPPLRNSYWVLPGKVLAGEHPIGSNPESTRERLQRLMDAGVECFIDLTEPSELKAYDGELPFSVEYLRKPIKDHGIPSQRVHMAEILDCLLDALSSGRCAYVHCRAGIGRTGTVIGCFLVERGFSGDAAIDELNRLWQHCERSQTWPSIPETDDQIAFVRGWKARGLFNDTGEFVPPTLTVDDDDPPPDRNSPPWAHLLADSRPSTSHGPSGPAPRGPTNTPSHPASLGAPPNTPANTSRTAAPSAPPAASGPARGAAANVRPDAAVSDTRGAVSRAASGAAAGGMHGATGNTAPGIASVARPGATQGAGAAAVPPNARAGTPSHLSQPASPTVGTPAPAASKSRSAAAPIGAPPSNLPGADGLLIDPTSVAKAFAPNTSSSAAGTPTLSAHHPSTNISGANTSGGLFPDEALDDPDPLLHPQALSAASNLRSRFLGALIGLAVGDAVAAATQYRRPGTFTPVGDMLGGGPFDLPRGAWTDDTAMALCLADSLLERNGFDARDQMERYRRWQQQGYLSATGQCVGITASAARAIAMSQWRRQAFSGSHDPAQLDPETLSRVAPAVLFFFANSSQAVELAAEAARTTCQVPAVLDTCRSLARALHAALSGQPKATVLEQAALAGSAPTARNAPNVGSALSSRSTPNAGTAPGARSAPTAGSFPSARSAPNAGSAPATHSSPIAGSAPGIRSAPNAGSTTNADTAPAAAGSSAAGAVSAASSGSASAAIPGARPEVRVGTSAPAALAAAIAAFGATDNFRDAILYAANLGGDSDVVAAICGQLAGAYYGVKAIPAPWYNSLMHKDLIASYADRLLTHTLVGLAG